MKCPDCGHPLDRTLRTRGHVYTCHNDACAVIQVVRSYAHGGGVDRSVCRVAVHRSAV